MKRRPKPQSVNEFISSAGNGGQESAEQPQEPEATKPAAKPSKPARSTRKERAAPKPEREEYTWHTAREDVKKDFLVRVEEEYHLKLRYLKDEGPVKSIQGFIREVIYPAIDAEIERLTGEKQKR